VVAEIVAHAYDCAGHAVFRPSKKRFQWFAPNAPMPRYIAQPLSFQCRDLNELRHFLLGCRYMSDEEQFGQLDYWNTPDDFEKRRQGDCDDFSLWTWRQLIGMGTMPALSRGRGVDTGRVMPGCSIRMMDAAFCSIRCVATSRRGSHAWQRSDIDPRSPLRGTGTG